LPTPQLNSKNEEVVSMMVVRLLFILIVLHFVAYVPDCVWAGDSTFRCGAHIIELGDSDYTVMTKCGPPSTRQNIGTSWRGSQTLPFAESRNVEQWIYNRGSNDFIYTLIFEGGSLTDISQGGRGF
jgi:hypothetical protein